MTTEELKVWAVAMREGELHEHQAPYNAILALIAEKEEIEAERERWAKWAVAAAEAEPLRARVKALEGALRDLIEAQQESYSVRWRAVERAATALAGEGKP